VVIQISMINWVGKHVTDSVDVQNVDATYDGATRLLSCSVEGSLEVQEKREESVGNLDEPTQKF